MCSIYREIKIEIMLIIFLSNMKNYIDLIIPRGGKSLVKKVLKKSTVSIIGHYEGLCHVYIDKRC